MIEEEQQQQFETIWSDQGHSIAQPCAFYQQLEACKEIEQNVIWESLNENIEDILTFCKDEYTSSGKNNHIISITFRKNQMYEFVPFFSRIYDELKDRKTQLFQGLGNEKISVTKISKCDVRDIVLHMYIYLEENPEFEVFVFLVDSLTDLDEQNIYCFEKGLKGKKFIAIIGTHHDFGSRSQAGLQNLEKFHYTLYNPRQLFSKYIYRCLTNNVIKPYLPPEILVLITDMDYYNISYHQSCRRFMYCFEKALLLGRWDRTYVEFDRLVTIIDTVIMNKFKTYMGAEIKKDKYLKVILDQKEIYTISERAIILQVAMAVGGPDKDKVKIEENIIINNIRESLRKKFSKEERFVKYIDFLEDKEQNMEVAMRRKKTRADQLGIDMKKNITPKNKLQNQLTAIIKSATQMIRKQSKHIRWQDIKLNLRIRPQLQFLIKKDWQENEKTEMLVEAITQNYSAPLTKYLKLFPSDRLGQGIYQIKCLQLAGLIEISKRSVKPIVTCRYFEKAVFSGKNT